MQDVYDDDDVVGVGADGGGEADDEDEDLEEQDQEEDLENGDDRQHGGQEDGEGLEAREQDDIREEGQEGAVVKEGEDSLSSPDSSGSRMGKTMFQCFCRVACVCHGFRFCSFTFKTREQELQELQAFSR